jgi:hypothetical protein
VQADALTDVERKIKDALGQGLLLLEDALEVAPPWLRHEPFDLGEPKSDLGKRLVAEIRKVPLSRFRRFRRAVASLLHAIARRLDAAPVPRMPPNAELELSGARTAGAPARPGTPATDKER